MSDQRFNTGNPIGSNSPLDRSDNTRNLDVAVNSDGDTFQDRMGKSRLTWAGMEQNFQQFLINSGYENIGDYGPGLEITARNQIFWRDGELYRAGAVLELPYTTTGDWGGEEGLFVAAGDVVLRQDLANPDMGAAMVARGVVAVDSIDDLLALPAGQLREDLRYLVKGYYAGSESGGGDFFVHGPSAGAAGNDGTILIVRGYEVRRRLDDAGTVTPQMFGIPDTSVDPDTSQTLAFEKMQIDPRIKQVYLDADYYIAGYSVVTDHFRIIGPGSINRLQVARQEPLPGTIIPRPAWFTWDSGVLPKYVGNGKWVAVNADGSLFDPRTLDTASQDPNCVSMYVNRDTGDDLNDGLSPETAVESLFGVQNRAAANGYQSVVAYISAGTYGRRDYVSSDLLGAGRNLTVKAVGGPVYLETAFHHSELTFTKVPSGDAAAGSYTAARSTVSTIWDSRFLDSDGYWSEMQEVATLAEMYPGAWYTDGVDIWIMSQDQREPDDDMHIIWDTQRNVWRDTTGNLYCEGVHFIGGAEAFLLSQTLGNTGRVVFVNGGFKYSQSLNGFASKGGNSYLFNCEGWRNMRDNINYHENDAQDVLANALEVNCFSDKAGRTNGEFGNNNASTGHFDAHVQRIGGEYMRSEGPNLPDVVRCNSWNTGVFAHDSEHPDPGSTTDTDFYINDGGIMRLDFCKAGGSGYDVTVFYSQGAEFECSGWQGGISIRRA